MSASTEIRDLTVPFALPPLSYPHQWPWSGLSWPALSSCEVRTSESFKREWWQVGSDTAGGPRLERLIISLRADGSTATIRTHLPTGDILSWPSPHPACLNLTQGLIPSSVPRLPRSLLSAAHSHVFFRVVYHLHVTPLAYFHRNH